MTPAAADILIATDVVSDGEMVRDLLAEEFDHVHVSSDPERSVADFETRHPAALVLAFNSLEKAERYYLGLYRFSAQIQSIPHRTVILCSREELRRTYEMCRRRYFDDYVLFWPGTNDGPRLLMSVHLALRGTGADALPPEVVAQARRIAELEAKLADYETLGSRHAENVARALRTAGQSVAGAIEGFSQRVVAGDLRQAVEIRDRGKLQTALSELHSNGVDPPLRAAAEALQPLESWTRGLRSAVAPQLEAARAFKQVAAQALPIVLVVDDDVFQHRVLAQMLASAGIALQPAATAAEAFTLLSKRRPDLVLLDIDLPDLSGIDALRQLRGNPTFSGVPVVMMTGHSERSLVIESLRAGANDYVLKPLNQGTLVSKLRKLLPAAALPSQSAA